MQGKHGQGSEPWKKPSDQRNPSLNGTGKHRAIPGGTGQYRAIPGETGQYRPIPQRPPGLPHVDTPPATPRIARPQPKPQRNGRRRLLFLGSLFLICAIAACSIGYAAFNFIKALDASSGAASTATDFLGALSQQNYDQAYRDLGPAITLRMTLDEFVRQAKSIDTCYGTLKSYSEVANSAVTQNTSQSYSYTITRSKSQQPYQLRLTLQQNQEDNTWKITDYGTSLGPAQSSGSCK